MKHSDVKNGTGGIHRARPKRSQCGVHIASQLGSDGEIAYDCARLAIVVNRPRLGKSSPDAA